MVRAFRFAGFPDIIFKNGAIAELPALLAKYGSPVILVTGKGSFINSEAGRKLFQELDITGLKYFHVIVAGEPSPSDIDIPVEEHRGRGIRAVVAIGGGSVLDAGKAISAMLTQPGSVKEYLEGVGSREHPGTKLPFIAIPTTSGTGSEATKNAVISEIGEKGFKKSLRHDHFIPDIALIDPGLTTACPPELTAASGMDCFTQLTEAFLSDKTSVYTDSLALMGLKEIKTSLPDAYLNGENIEARAGMSLAALNSGICLANAGLGTVHGFASVIGGYYNIPHGLVCGTLMAAANRVNVRELRKSDPESVALAKYTQLGKLFLEEEGKTDAYYIDGFIDVLYSMTSLLGLPGLSEYGLSHDSLKSICEKTGNKNNPVELSIENRMEILGERLIS